MGFLKRTAKGPVAWGAVIAGYIALLLVAAYVQYSAHDERSRAIDQFCTVQESVNAKNVKQLDQTYKYLVKLKPEELNSTINVFIIQNLSKQEAEAHADVAPAICDEKYTRGLFTIFGLGETLDYGNPEPDPVIPDRPKNLPIESTKTEPIH